MSTILYIYIYIVVVHVHKCNGDFILPLMLDIYTHISFWLRTQSSLGIIGIENYIASFSPRHYLLWSVGKTMSVWLDMLSCVDIKKNKLFQITISYLSYNHLSRLITGATAFCCHHLGISGNYGRMVCPNALLSILFSIKRCYRHFIKIPGFRNR